jgi:hypothetical protein
MFGFFYEHNLESNTNKNHDIKKALSNKRKGLMF